MPHVHQKRPRKPFPARTAKRLRQAIDRFLHPPTEKKVDFMIAGAAKSGTTALGAYMREHPAICFSRKPYTHFFDRDHLFEPRPRYKLYHSYFRPDKLTRIIGELTPGYMAREQAWPRIKAYNPDMKVIIQLRNPIERAYSHWNQARRRNAPPSFKEALEREARGQPGFVNRGRYLRQLETIWESIPREQILIYKSEDLLNDPQPTLNRVYDFLGIERFEHKQEIRANVGSYDSPMSDEDRAQVIERLAPEIKAIEEALGWDCSDWLR